MKCPLGMSECFQKCVNRCTPEGFKMFMHGPNHERALKAGKKTTKGKRRRGILNGSSAYMTSYQDTLEAK